MFTPVRNLSREAMDDVMATDNAHVNATTSSSTVDNVKDGEVIVDAMKNMMGVLLWSEAPASACCFDKCQC